MTTLNRNWISRLIRFEPILKLIDVNGLYTQAIVAITAGILTVLGIASTCQSSIINLFSIPLDVKFKCNGLATVMIYSVPVIAFPASWKKKLIGISLGVFFITLNYVKSAGKNAP